MKALEFETSKGKFKLIDMPETIRINGWNGTIVIDEVNQISQEKYAKGFYLKNITEEQASEVVDFFTEYSKRFQDYERLECAYLTAIESLHSLLKSKGIHLFKNKAPLLHHTRLEQEQKTFYNPYIFKL